MQIWVSSRSGQVLRQNKNYLLVLLCERLNCNKADCHVLLVGVGGVAHMGIGISRQDLLSEGQGEQVSSNESPTYEMLPLLPPSTDIPILLAQGFHGLKLETG